MAFTIIDLPTGMFIKKRLHLHITNANYKQIFFKIARFV